jgi:hypothetical protein
VPFPHQCDLWLALDGYLLTPQVLLRWEKIEQYLESPHAFLWMPGFTQDVQLGDKSVERRIVLPRPEGLASAAADLAAFKGGKSQQGADYVSGEMLVPGVRWDLIGWEYSTCDMEFGYIIENLFSAKGLNLPLKKPLHGGLYAERYSNRPENGRMLCVLSNGAAIEARSWDRADALKGKTRDGYLYCEAYQLPGFKVYTEFKQNLDVRSGKAIFATTPDSPWVDVLDKLGHDKSYPEYWCISGVGRDTNPYTYNERTMKQDQTLMTTEKFQIAYHGQIGEYIGSVFKYRRGQRLFTPQSHPDLWKDENGPSNIANLKIPPFYAKVAGGDTGTMRSAVLCAFDNNDPPNCFVIAEVPNYRYVATEIEDLDIPPSDWYQMVRRTCNALGFRKTLYCDHNSQFKRDSVHYGINLVPGEKHPEARTEILREYFEHNRIFFAPWLEVLPFEVELAVYPDKSTSTGAWRREKKDDHSLDGLEHVCARRPSGRKPDISAPGRFAEQYLREGARWKRSNNNPWVGRW